ncbi:hypothetical protein NIE79_005063 [Micromonospora sp. NIE79]|uniref:Uncharacterized protein n=1 Tax=Micromonospora trifolii TaxID=2911208 RepID=A0ABS9MWF4_9ACTN|nr:hypothetical protein [Micromonospora trifolii]MCG5442007.1 hypothetical protein [Micromonospora trifolii]
MARPPTNAGLSAPERFARLGQLQRMTPQARALLLGDGVPTVFLRDPEQLVDRSGVCLRSGFLQHAFETARRDNPGLTVGGFLASGQYGSQVTAVVDALLGEASATLLRTSDPARYVDALRRIYADFRTVSTPFDGGVSYGSHRYHDGSHLVLPDGLNVTPMNAPVGPDLHYPAYGGVVTSRGHRSIAMVLASRVWDREIPLTARGPDLFRELQVRSVNELHAWDYDPDLLMSEVQIAHMISTGDAPIYRFSFDKGPPSARTMTQARWELAAQLEDERILTADNAELQRLWDRHGRSDAAPRGDPTDLNSRYGRDPYYRLSRNRLFETAMGLPSARNVAIRPYEWEHARPQRFIREMQAWTRRLRRNLNEDLWSSRLSMLTGASEPGNLQLLTPPGHALDDIYAARMMGGVTRVDRWGNRLVPTVAEEAAYDSAARAQDLTLGEAGATLQPFARTDIERASESVMAFDQRTLADLTAALHEAEWQRALASTPDAIYAWNRLVERLNRQVDAYGMPTALRLPSL